MTVTYTHSDTVQGLIEPVSKVLANCIVKNNEPIDFHSLSEGVKTILRIWKKNKNRFYYNLFNDNTIAEFGEVSVNLSPEQKNKLAEEFLDLMAEDWDAFAPGFENYWYDRRTLLDFLYENRDNLFNNKTIKDFEAPDGTIIASGTKISKSIKHFFDNEELVRFVQDKYSQLIQQDKVTGILCASIHPLDFLSASENNYKWRSCHALNGDCAGGNMSYMMDNCTIMFYLKGADEVKLPRFPDDILWDDKKWRMLVFLEENNEVVWAGRQYPFFSEELLNLSLDCLNRLIDNTYEFNDFIKWESDYIESFEGTPLKDKYILQSGTLMTRHMLIKDAKGATHYNDLLYSSYYTPYFAFRPGVFFDGTSYPTITIGHTPVCACCGTEKLLLTKQFICDDCRRKLRPPQCNHCHKSVKSTNDLFWYPSLGRICSDCQDELTELCPHCGNRIVKGSPCWCLLTTSDSLSINTLPDLDEISQSNTPYFDFNDFVSIDGTIKSYITLSTEQINQLTGGIENG